MMNKKDFTILKDGSPVNAHSVCSFDLPNGKTYLIYRIDDDTDMYASIVVEHEENIELLGVAAEDMELIKQAIANIEKKEVE